MKIITISVTPFLQNCRIIACEETNNAVVVDPGGDCDKIISALKENNLSLNAIWLTHGHLDHVGGAGTLRDIYDVKILGPHEDDKFWFQNLLMQAQMFGFETIEPFYPDDWLAHGSTVSVGNLTFEVMHCPGHTPGHIVFYQSTSQCVLVGDVIFKGSVGRTDFPKGNSEQLIESIKKRILALPDNTKILSGHGANTTVSYETQTNPFVSGQYG